MSPQHLPRRDSVHSPDKKKNVLSESKRMGRSLTSQGDETVPEKMGEGSLLALASHGDEAWKELMERFEKGKLKNERVEVAVHAKVIEKMRAKDAKDEEKEREEMIEDEKLEAAKTRSDFLKEMDSVRVKRLGKEPIQAWRL